MKQLARHDPVASQPVSAAARWAPLARLIDRERAIALAARRNGRVWLFAYEFIRFGIKQAWACLFGGLMLALLVATYLWYPPNSSLARYDFLVIGALAIQAAMLWLRLETLEEAKLILVFHVVGTAMEIFKTSAGSWVYPDSSLLRIAGVPLFTGFMYAAVGSYLARVWRLFDFKFTRHPPLWALGVLAAAIYVNFFTHHFMADFRIALFLAAALMFGQTWVHYRIWQRHRSMPLLVGLGLVANFVWLAENIGTYARAWSYPHQLAGWSPVPAGKFGAWFLLMLISYALVAWAHRHAIVEPAAARDPARASTGDAHAASSPLMPAAAAMAARHV